MRVIARGTLNSFVRNRVDAKHQKTLKAQLNAWYAEVARAEWKSSAELKSQYNSASIVSAERAVFNIKGNDYRLVVAIQLRLPGGTDQVAVHPQGIRQDRRGAGEA